MDKVQKDLFPAFLESVRWVELKDSGPRILAALSGGPDSVALCDLLQRTGEKVGFKIVAAHLNHGIRGTESDEDENFVREFCKARNIPLEIEKIDVPELAKSSGHSLEMTARSARYNYLGQAAARLGISVIAIGHNADDRIETLFMRLLRGSGGKGLGALQPVRCQGGITFVRPILGFFRHEIIDYLEFRNIGFRIDSTNLDTSTDRGKIRNVLLPKFIETANGLGWESVMDSLGRSAELLSEDEAVLQEISVMYEGGIRFDESDGIHLNCRQFSGLPAPILARIVLASIERLDPSLRPERIHIGRIIDMLGTVGGSAFDIPGGLRVESSGDDVVIHVPPVQADRPGQIEIILDELPVKTEFGPYSLTIEKLEKLENINSDPYRTQTGVEPSHDGVKIAIPEGCNRLVIRSVEDGDRIRPLGMKGHSSKISDIFIDRKIPRESRLLEPMIIDGSSGEILGIPGLKIVSESAKLTYGTVLAVMVTALRG